MVAFFHHSSGGAELYDYDINKQTMNDDKLLKLLELMTNNISSLEVRVTYLVIGLGILFGSVISILIKLLL